MAGKKGTVTEGRIPLEKRLRIQRLFVHEGCEAEQIAADVRLTLKQVKGMIYGLGLIARRKEFELTAMSAVAEVDAAKAEKRIVDEVSAEIGSRSGEMALGALSLAEHKLQRQDALGTKLAMSAAKDAYGIFRQAKGLDRDGNGSVGGQVNLSVLVGNFPDAKVEKVVEPVEEAVAF